MFYGHPVERLCTYQYSLISLLPGLCDCSRQTRSLISSRIKGLLQALDDCGSPPLATRASTLTRPTSLRTSDRKSMLAYVGLPLDIFGKVCHLSPLRLHTYQDYCITGRFLPTVSAITATRHSQGNEKLALWEYKLHSYATTRNRSSCKCEYSCDMSYYALVLSIILQTETGTFEFRDSKLERSAGLTAADRKWMDNIVKDVNDGWNEADPTRPINMQYVILLSWVTTSC